MTDLTFHSITIQNFKSFVGKHTFKLNRGPGLFYVSGRNELEPELGANGVGKSTIWDALLWCLYGKTGRDSRPGEAIVPWELKGKTTRVKLKLGKHLLVRKRHPNDLLLNGQTVSQPDIDKLLQNLPIRYTLILTQFGSMFLDLKPEAQSQMFNEILNLDVWLGASERAGNKHKVELLAIQECRNSLMDIKGRISEIKNSIQTETRLANLFDDEQAELVKDRVQTLAQFEKQLAEIKVNEDQSWLKNKCKLLESKRIQAQTKRMYLVGEKEKYEQAIANNHTCPECGHKVPLAHLKDKFENLVTEFHTVRAKEKKIQAIWLKYDNRLFKQEGLLARKSDLQRAIEITEQQSIPTHNIHKNNLKVHRKRLRSLRDERVEFKSKIKELSVTLGMFRYWIDAFKEIRLNLIDQVLVELSMTATTHAEALGLEGWKIEFKTERETKSGTVSIAFTTLLYPPDKLEPVKWESYSGGESQRWQLAVSFGLSEILLSRAGVEPNIECYDEPTRGLSPEGIDKLLEHLGERARSLNRSIYLVEHHSLDKGSFDGVITIVKDEKGSHIHE